MTQEGHRVEELKTGGEDGLEPEPHRGVDASLVLVADDPRQDTAGAKHPAPLIRDASQLAIESPLAAGDPPEAPGVVAVHEVVRVRGVDNRQGRGPIRQGPTTGVRADDVPAAGCNVQ